MKQLKWVSLLFQTVLEVADVGDAIYWRASPGTCWFPSSTQQPNPKIQQK